ncbi:MAG TPA: c-type cytochrome domain-containing protein [Ignavibacteriaceae bacterium]|nr:c-type cytochrome domain-containing protein [Ignavibacteriaceae bacterium]
MKNIYSVLYLVIFLLLAAYSGCKDTITNEDLDKKIIPDKNVSYKEYIGPVFNYKCANAGCHDDAAKAGGLSLTSWVNATADPSVIARGEPDNSKLVWAIEGLSAVSIMPPVGYPPLTANQINGVKTWIKEGAQNN